MSGCVRTAYDFNDVWYTKKVYDTPLTALRHLNQLIQMTINPDIHYWIKILGRSNMV